MTYTSSITSSYSIYLLYRNCVHYAMILQRYATGGVTGFFVRELGRRAGVPVQEFSVRNDCPCGSTIGPVLSQNLGVRAVDLGMPQV